MKNNLASLMSKNIVTLPLGTLVSEAQSLMKDKRFRHVPIVNDEKIIVGILSARDLKKNSFSQQTVESLMSTPIDFVEEKTSLRSAILKMLEKKISCLLVANENQDVVGIITTEDLMWHLAELLKTNSTLSGLLNAQTVGEIANELALIGF